MATYNFNPNAAQEVEDQLRRVTKELDDSLARLEQAVAYFQARNVGTTVDNYTEAQKQWNDGQGQMHTAMTKGYIALAEISHDYQLTDNRGAQFFGQLL